MIKVQLNGEDHEVEERSTVLDLLEALGFSPVKIAVEHNLEVVPKSAYAETVLSDGDRIEIVRFIGGG